jgi:hypothetical protein
MSAVPSAIAALDGHRGVAVVAEYGLGFLFNLSIPDANSVRLGVPGSVVGPRDSDRSTGGRVSELCSHAHPRGLVWWEGGLGWAEPMWMGKWGEAWRER